jgi:hypothetical protein
LASIHHHEKEVLGALIDPICSARVQDIVFLNVNLTCFARSTGFMRAKPPLDIFSMGGTLEA